MHPSSETNQEIKPEPTLLSSEKLPPTNSFWHLKWKKAHNSCQTEEQVTPKPPSGNRVKFPFSLKLGLSLSLLSVGLTTTSMGRLYYKTHVELLSHMGQELQNFGTKEVSSFKEEDIQAIQELKAQAKSLSRPIPQKILASQEPSHIDALISEDAKKQFLKSANYQRIAKKLGSITNKSRNDNNSDIFVISSYLVVPLSESPNKKILLSLADDQFYRYGSSHNDDHSWIASYYIAGSSAIYKSLVNGQSQSDNQYYADQWGNYLTAAIPVKTQNGQIIGVVALDIDVSSIAKQFNALTQSFLQITIVSIIVSLIIAILIARRLVQPINQLSVAAAKIRNHNFDTLIELKSNDEFQVLAETFNSMVAEIRKYTLNLENLVIERTNELAKTKQELEIDIEKGQKLQQDFLPDPLLKLPEWDIAATFHPAKKVAGDFYDVFVLPGDQVGLVIADVCDKGVGAAMFMGLFRSFIRVFSGHICLDQNLPIDCRDQVGASTSNSNTETEFHLKRALRAVEITNNYIGTEHGMTGMFATMFFGVLDPKTGSLTYINGGHESLYVVNCGTIKQTLGRTGPAVGMFPDIEFKIAQVQLETGDILMGYTDGVTDARSPQGKFFGDKRLMALVNQPAASASELLERIKTDVFVHIDSASQFDDITMLAVQRLGSQET